MQFWEISDNFLMLPGPGPGTADGHVASVANVTRCRVLATWVSLTTDLLVPLELQFTEISDNFLNVSGPGPGPGGDHVASVTTGQ